MNSVPFNLVLLFGTLGLGALLGGGAMTTVFTSELAGIQSLYWGGGLWSLGVAGLIGLQRNAQKHAAGVLQFMALATNIGFTSILTAISLPLIFSSKSLTTIITFVLYTMIVLTYQLWRAKKHFTEQWITNNSLALAKSYHTSRSTISITTLLKHLNFRSDIFFPANWVLAKALMGLLLIFLMVISLNFRKLYPELSALAGGISAITGAIMFVQLSFLPLLVARQIRILEKSSGKIISPVSDNCAHPPTQRKRIAKRK